MHTATRTDALVSYATDFFKVGGEYFQADNWSNVTTAGRRTRPTATPVWAQVFVNPTWAVFARYDTAKPSKDLKPKLE